MVEILPLPSTVKANCDAGKGFGARLVQVRVFRIHGDCGRKVFQRLRQVWLRSVPLQRRMNGQSGIGASAGEKYLIVSGIELNGGVQISDCLPQIFFPLLSSSVSKGRATHPDERPQLECINIFQVEIQRRVRPFQRAVQRLPGLQTVAESMVGVGWIVSEWRQASPTGCTFGGALCCARAGGVIGTSRRSRSSAETPGEK